MSRAGEQTVTTRPEVSIMAAHADYVSQSGRHCTCGRWSDERPEANITRELYAGHLMAELEAAGYVIVPVSQALMPL